MASLSDVVSRLLSSSTAPPSLSPSPPNQKPITRPRTCTFPSSISTAKTRLSLHLTTTKSSFKSNHDDDVVVTNRVAYPSLANANLVFFKSGNYNVEVVPKDGESEEQLVNEFKRSVFRAGVLQETRRRRFFESSLEKRKRKTKEATKKYRKRRPNAKPKPSYSAPETAKKRREVEEDDNWELPPEEIEIPYTSRF
ncbi:hypothetical protein N665_0503s0024 [Sinapis alba]|nr:hypothetical protein N665_0503s0024 [Sinapis alba]